MEDEDRGAGGILYAPDYVINGGGVINVYGELHPLAGRALAEGGGDLRDPAAYLRDRPDRSDSHLPGGGSAGRAAHRGVGGLDAWMGAGASAHPLPRR